jgi:hypothetical protein
LADDLRCQFLHEVTLRFLMVVRSRRVFQGAVVQGASK